MLALDESSHIVDAEYGVGGKNKVTRVTWFSFGTLQLIITLTRQEVMNVKNRWTTSAL